MLEEKKKRPNNKREDEVKNLQSSQYRKSEGQKSAMIGCIRYTTRIGIKLHFEFRLDCLYTFQMFSQKSLLLITVERCHM